MPLEILQGHYLRMGKVLPRMNNSIRKKISNREPKRAVVHNHGHDFECLWWISLWLVTRRVKGNPIDAFKSVFSHSLQATGPRVTFFTTGVPDISDEIHSSLVCLAAPLDFLREQLYSECITINANDPLPSDSIEEIASRYSFVVVRPFSIFFQDIEETRPTWDQIQLTPVSAKPKT
jgi:hypothetical protein